jgi:RimJ/RimL family protein N-acetyltransferase
MQLSRIISVTKKDNSKAIQLLKRLGFVEVAHLENNYTTFELKKPNDYDNSSLLTNL